MSEKTAVQALQAEIDEGDRVHSVVVTGQGNEGELYLLVTRTTTHDTGQTVLDMRTFVAEPDGDGYFTGNGVWVPASKHVANALVRAMSRTSNDYPEDKGNPSLLIDGRDIEHEPESDLVDTARDLLTTPLIDFKPEAVDHSKETVEVSGPMVTCEKCGNEVPKEDALNFGGGVLDAWVHAEGCPDE